MNVVKQVKSYSLPPAQIAWLRERAAKESTPDKTISASAILERIIEDAMSNQQVVLPIPTNKQSNRKSAASVAV